MLVTNQKSQEITEMYHLKSQHSSLGASAGQYFHSSAEKIPTSPSSARQKGDSSPLSQVQTQKVPLAVQRTKSLRAYLLSKSYLNQENLILYLNISSMEQPLFA